MAWTLATAEDERRWVVFVFLWSRSDGFDFVANVAAQRVLVGARYLLQSRVDTRAWGSLWLARDEATGAPCAVRLGDGPERDRAELCAAYRAEKDATARIRCQNVVDWADHGEWEGMPFLAMRESRSEALAARLERLGRLEPRAAYCVVAEIACALAHAHAVGLVHRDLTPEGVLLVTVGEQEIAKVIGWGAPRRRSRSFEQLSLPYYASPERLRGAPLDGRADLWSLAVIAYECLSGARPFSGESLDDLLASVLEGPLPIVPLPDSGPSLWVHRWWKKAAARSREERFQSAKELGDALGSALRLPRLPIPDMEPRPPLDSNAPASESRVLSAPPRPRSPWQSDAPVPSEPPAPSPAGQALTDSGSSEPPLREEGTHAVQPSAIGAPEPRSQEARARASSSGSAAPVIQRVVQVGASAIPNANQVREQQPPAPPEPPYDDAAGWEDETPLAVRTRRRWFRIAVPAALLLVLGLVALGGWLRFRAARSDGVAQPSEVLSGHETSATLRAVAAQSSVVAAPSTEKGASEKRVERPEPSVYPSQNDVKEVPATPLPSVAATRPPPPRRPSEAKDTRQSPVSSVTPARPAAPPAQPEDRGVTPPPPPPPPAPPAAPTRAPGRDYGI